jgi:hypothetical protein
MIVDKYLMEEPDAVEFSSDETDHGALWPITAARPLVNLSRPAVWVACSQISMLDGLKPV